DVVEGVVDGRFSPGGVGLVGVRLGTVGATDVGAVVLGDVLLFGVVVGLGALPEPPDRGAIDGAPGATVPGVPAPPPRAPGGGFMLPGRATEVTSPPTDSGAAALESTCLPSVAVPVSVPNPVIATCAPWSSRDCPSTTMRSPTFNPFWTTVRSATCSPGEI